MIHKKYLGATLLYYLMHFPIPTLGLSGDSWSLPRRKFFTSVSSASFGAVVTFSDSQQHAALAADGSRMSSATRGPSISGLEGVQRALELKRRPQPLTMPRRKLEKDFAVLLMRSSYQVADDLDFCAMDQFQKEFFIFRQSEYSDYVDSLQGSPMVQGELSDSKYLDFISFAQYDTVGSLMRRGEVVFTEAVGSDGVFTDQLVRRGNGLSNEDLPLEFDRLVGDRVLEWLVDRYDTGGDRVLSSGSTGGGGSSTEGGGLFSPSSDPIGSRGEGGKGDDRGGGGGGGGGVDLVPQDAGVRLAARAAKASTSGAESDEACCVLRLAQNPSGPFLLANLKQLLNLFQVNGYLLGYDAVLAAGNAKLTVTVSAPATRWSQEVLAQRKCLLGNAFELKAVLAYLRACGVEYAPYNPSRDTRFRGLDVTHTITLRGFR